VHEGLAAAALMLTSSIILLCIFLCRQETWEMERRDRILGSKCSPTILRRTLQQSCRHRRHSPTCRQYFNCYSTRTRPGDDMRSSRNRLPQNKVFPLIKYIRRHV